jgi:pimeloyl-ACP methyl ester carboxylesterase
MGLFSASVRRAQARKLAAAQLRVLVALAAGYEVPLVGNVLRTARVSETEFGGAPATFFRPRRGTPATRTVMVVPGVTRRGRMHPAFVGIGHGLAAAGLATAVVEPSGLTVGELTPQTLAHTIAAAEELSSSAEAQDGRLALAGVSGGATLALLVASSEGLVDRISAVAALAPCCDIREALRLVTTDGYRHDRGLVSFRTGNFFRLVLARSAAAWLEDGGDRRDLREHLLGLPDYGEDPLRALRSWPRDVLGRDAGAVVALLANADPGRFEELYEGLSDGQQDAVEALSPLRTAPAVTAPVELVVARNDKYIPLDDARAFARACPRSRITVIESLEHAVPSVSPGAVRDLARLDGAAVRFLAASYSAP